jgi:protein involved in polysaccharide export with SLBB domain
MLPFKWYVATVLTLATASAAFAETTITNAVAPADSANVLQPGDVIRLRIWREPDLSGDFPVDETGVVVFPKIGPLPVTNQGPDALKAKLVTAYQVYLRNPSVEVTMLRRVTILGAVRNAGLYPLDPTLTVADALALAGGIMPHGSPDKVAVVRGGERLTTKLSQRTRIADSPIRSGDQIYVPERSWLSRNTGVVATGLSASVSLVIALFIR